MRNRRGCRRRRWAEVLASAPIRLVETAKAPRQRQSGRARDPGGSCGRRRRPAARSSRSARSTAAPRSTSRSTRRDGAPSSRSICRPISRRRFRSKRRSGNMSTSRVRRPAALVSSALAECRRRGSRSCSGIRRPTTGRRTMAGPGSCSSTARTPTTMRAAIPRPRCGWCDPGGMVIWHDYGVWPGVTRALEELEASRNLGLRHIRGTSLVFWRAPAGPIDRWAAGAGQRQPDPLSVPATAAASVQPPV